MVQLDSPQKKIQYNTKKMQSECQVTKTSIRKYILIGSNPLNAKLNSICHLLALLGAHHILHVSRLSVNNHFFSTATTISRTRLKIM